MNDIEVRKQLRSWIFERANLGSSFELADDQPIIGDELLSSLDVVELVLFIEHLRGEEIDLELLQSESFSSIDALLLAFFSTTPAE